MYTLDFIGLVYSFITAAPISFISNFISTNYREIFPFIRNIMKVGSYDKSVEKVAGDLYGTLISLFSISEIIKDPNGASNRLLDAIVAKKSDRILLHEFRRLVDTGIHPFIA